AWPHLSQSVAGEVAATLSDRAGPPKNAEDCRRRAEGRAGPPRLGYRAVRPPGRTCRRGTARTRARGLLIVYIHPAKYLPKVGWPSQPQDWKSAVATTI